MKIEYDTVHDLLAIEFLADVPIDHSRKVDGLVIDYARDERIVAVALLDAGKRTTGKPLALIWPSSGRGHMLFTQRSGKRYPNLSCSGLAEGDS